MFSEWGSGLSGPFSVPLAIASLWWRNPPGRLLFGSLAIIMGCFSAYRIWSREYDRAEVQAETLLALNARPEINLEVRCCFWFWANYSTVQVVTAVRLTNVRDVNTTIKDYSVILSTPGKTQTISASPCEGFLEPDSTTDVPEFLIPDFTNGVLAVSPVSIDAESPLTRGVHRGGWLVFNPSLVHLETMVTNRGSTQATLTLEVIDSFGTIHQSTPTELVMRHTVFTRRA